jgi:serine/threonine protein kinase
MVGCSGKYPPIPTHYSSELQSLVNALLERDTRARPTMEEAITLDFVRKHINAYACQICGDIKQSRIRNANQSYLLDEYKSGESDGNQLKEVGNFQLQALTDLTSKGFFIARDLTFDLLCSFCMVHNFMLIYLMTTVTSKAVNCPMTS